MKIAITGHQNLGGPATVKWLRLQIQEELKKINIKKIDQAYSCLASGSDQIFAEIIVQHNIDLIAVIPSYKYDTTFSNQNDLNNYIKLKQRASEVIQLDYTEPSETAFFQASKLIVNRCEIVLAIWNSLPSKGLGGTADVVAYARGKKKNIIHINLLNKTIKNY